MPFTPCSPDMGVRTPPTVPACPDPSGHLAAMGEKNDYSLHCHFEVDSATTSGATSAGAETLPGADVEIPDSDRPRTFDIFKWVLDGCGPTLG